MKSAREKPPGARKRHQNFYIAEFGAARKRGEKISSLFHRPAVAEQRTLLATAAPDHSATGTRSRTGRASFFTALDATRVRLPA